MKNSNLKLHLGCGTNQPLDWINVDNSPNALLAKLRGHSLIKFLLFKLKLMSEEAYKASWGSNVLYCDLSKDFPKIPKNTCSAIYTSHFLEHITYNCCVNLVNKCYKTLVPGGVLRIAVPDLYLEAKQYVQKIENALKNGLEDYKASEDFIKNMVSRTKRHSHLWMYDLFSISHLLKGAGFVEINKKSFLESEIDDIESVEKREDSLFIECKKP